MGIQEISKLTNHRIESFVISDLLPAEDKKLSVGNNIYNDTRRQT